MKHLTRKIIAALAIFGFLASSTVAFAAPFDLEITHRDLGDVSDVPQNLTPPTLMNGTNYIPLFDDTNELYKFVAIGSGIGYSSTANLISVTPGTIETVDGHLSDTLALKASAADLTALTSTVNGLTSTVGTHTSQIGVLLAGGPAFNIGAFMGNSASTTPYVASSSPGFMSGAMVDKLTALSTSSPLKAYEGTTLRTGAFPIFKSATVSSGVAVVNLTSDGTSGGTSLCTGGVIADSVNPTVSDATASYQMSWAFSNSNKTLTITTNKLTTANILTGILGQSAANSAVVKVSAWCYA